MPKFVENEAWARTKLIQLLTYNPSTSHDFDCWRRSHSFVVWYHVVSSSSNNPWFVIHNKQQPPRSCKQTWYTLIQHTLLLTWTPHSTNNNNNNNIRFFIWMPYYQRPSTMMPPIQIIVYYWWPAAPSPVRPSENALPKANLLRHSLNSSSALLLLARVSAHHTRNPASKQPIWCIEMSRYSPLLFDLSPFKWISSGQLLLIPGRQA